MLFITTQPSGIEQNLPSEAFRILKYRSPPSVAYLRNHLTLCLFGVSTCEIFGLVADRVPGKCHDLALALPCGVEIDE